MSLESPENSSPATHLNQTDQAGVVLQIEIRDDRRNPDVPDVDLLVLDSAPARLSGIQL